MNQYLIAALIGGAIIALLIIVSLVAGAVENIRIAKHTGIDPRADKAARKAARQELRR